VLGAAARRHRDAALPEPSLHLGDLPLLLDDHRLGELPGPGLPGVRQGDLSHRDRAPVMRDHLEPEIDIRIPGIGDRHGVHHLSVCRLEAPGRRRVGLGTGSGSGLRVTLRMGRRTFSDGGTRRRKQTRYPSQASHIGLRCRRDGVRCGGPAGYHEGTGETAPASRVDGLGPP